MSRLRRLFQILSDPGSLEESQAHAVSIGGIEELNQSVIPDGATAQILTEIERVTTEKKKQQDEALQARTCSRIS